MKKRGLFAILISLCIVLVIVSCAAPAPAPAPKPAPAPAPAAKLPEKISFSTHQTGTTHFAVATGLGKIASEKGPILVSVAATSGPASWVPGMNDTGNPQIGTAHTMDAWWAYTGKISPRPIPDNMLGNTPFYAKAYTNLRVLLASARMCTGFLVRADSKYKTAIDLKGARVGSGYLAQPSAFISMIADIVNANMTLKDFNEVTVAGPAPGVTALGEDRIDSTNASVGMGQITEVDAKSPVRFMPASSAPADVKRAEDAFAGGTYTIWKAGEGAGLKVDTLLWTYPIMLVVPASLPDAVAESLLGTWWDNYKLLWEVHPALKKITSPEMFFLQKTTVPYHTGAVSFFKKKGLWDAKQDTYQDRLLKGEYPFLD
jgi:TRAP transporter TAXI family solute receptor